MAAATPDIRAPPPSGRSLSGGQKQAIGLARTLIRKPKVLFLDEPTSHFDIRSEAEFVERLKELAVRDMTIIISTHRLSLLGLVDRLLLFERGRLAADGPRDQVIALLQGAQSRDQEAPGAPSAPPVQRPFQPAPTATGVQRGSPQIHTIVPPGGKTNATN